MRVGRRSIAWYLLTSARVIRPGRQAWFASAAFGGFWAARAIAPATAPS